MRGGEIIGRGKLTSIERKSIAEAVVEKIRDGILTAQIKSGEKLREQEICDELNVSRTPVREAFRTLQSQNLVDYSPYVGVTVKNLTPRYVEEMWYIKSLLEPESAALAAANATEQQINQLKSIVDEIEDKWLDSPGKFNSLDSIFHIKIASISGNEELQKLLTNIYNSTVLPRSRTVLNNRTIKNACEEHRLIIGAIENKDPELARKYTIEHLDISKAAILKNLEADFNN